MAHLRRMLLVSGSLRAKSTNTAVLRTARATAPAGIVATLYEGLAHLPHFNSDDDVSPLPPSVAELRAEIRKADALIFSTPEYAGSPAGRSRTCSTGASATAIRGRSTRSPSPGSTRRRAGAADAPSASTARTTSRGGCSRDKGYEVRQVPFRNGGLEPDDIARARRRRHRAGRVQRRADRDRAPFRHPGDQRDRASGRRDRVRRRLAARRRAARSPTISPRIDVLATADHKFLLHAGRGLGYCYLSPRGAGSVHAGQRGLEGGRVPFESFFGPTMDLSPTASRFDNSISWLAAIGNEAALVGLRRRSAPTRSSRRNRELADAAPRRARRGRLDAGRPARGRTAAPSCRCRSATPTRRSCSPS